ncbi:L-galactonolactone oxidase [Trypanosoma equiperdum]|uniref:L-galactonolactone oxidase n=1 Tax=Trypanosoma equiperdum TaxID=5694 RepID=A0A1G4HZK3_TRYEQ|nr:L-galactonolactone oxidase [Trypanosoma equiperdum]
MGQETMSDGTWTNFANIGKCFPRKHHYPNTVEEVSSIIKVINSAGERCRVVGGGKSPNSCTFTNGHLIHMDRLNRITSIDEKSMTIVCEGGALISDVFERLSAHDLMLRCVPSFVQTTVGGVIATATHSSGIRSRSISDCVVRLQLVDGRGILHTFDASTPKELSLSACHLGMLGVVVSVTLQAEKKRLWRIESRPIPFRKLTEGDTLKKRIAESEFYRFFWMPNTDQCYESIAEFVGEEGADQTKRVDESIKLAMGKKHEATLPMTAGNTITKLTSSKLRNFSSEKCNSTGEDYQMWLRNQRTLRTRICKILKGNWLRHGVVEAALAAAVIQPGIQPYINRTYRRLFYNAPEVQYGTSLECFTFDCLFKQWACEWAIDISNVMPAFHYLRDLISSENLSVHFPVEFRFTGADTAALSPAHGRQTCWIGIVMYRPYLRHARDTLRYYDAFSKAMTVMGGRPHWAKYYTWGPEQMLKAYGKNWEDFLLFRKKMDPEGVFLNGWFNSLSGNSPVLNSTISHL